MNYKETIDYLYSCLPSLDKKGWGAYKPGLARVKQMLDLLGNPQNSYKIIHVAGTNGKGSVSHMLASVLQESGLKVGLFTSPHLKDFRERIKVNGTEISEKEVVSFVQGYSVQSKTIAPSFFEYTFALAVNYFKSVNVDVVIIETGLGGRLDCTNVVDPVLSVITNISLDHEQFLGNTLRKIASEKAGIIKSHVPVVVGRQQKEIEKIFIEVAASKKSPLHFANKNTAIFPCELKGIYQVENQRTVLECITTLNALQFPIQEANTKKGLEHVVSNTGLKGRWQELSVNPKVICDVGHNADGVRELIKQLADELYSNIRVVWGMSEDKNTKEILELLPADYDYYWCASQNLRSLDATKLKTRAKTLGLEGQVFASVDAAYQQAFKDLKKDEMLFVGGSVFVVSEVI
ncbi:MAG: dihydrofolate synthase/folylpolyglutamate synthase [Saprospiraceae bacterium]|jgi:dihydrofolate synthase/folylpolyglutamate synthase